MSEPKRGRSDLPRMHLLPVTKSGTPCSSSKSRVSPLLLWVLILPGMLACDPAAQTDAKPGAIRGGAPQAVAEEDVESLVRLGTKSVNFLAEQAAEERASKESQRALLDQKIARARDLVNANALDEAELELIDVYWKPVTSPNNDNDKALIEQYDERRKALQAIIERKRAVLPK